MLKWPRVSNNFLLVSIQISKGIAWPYYKGEKAVFVCFCRPYGSISGVMTPSLLELSALPPVAAHSHALLMLFSMLQLVAAKSLFTLYKIICVSVFFLSICPYTCWLPFGTIFVKCFWLHCAILVKHPRKFLMDCVWKIFLYYTY